MVVINIVWEDNTFETTHNAVLFISSILVLLTGEGNSCAHLILCHHTSSMCYNDSRGFCTIDLWIGSFGNLFSRVVASQCRDITWVDRRGHDLDQNLSWTWLWDLDLLKPNLAL